MQRHLSGMKTALGAITGRCERVLPARFRRISTTDVETDPGPLWYDGRQPVPHIPGVISIDLRGVFDAARVFSDQMRATTAALNKAVSSPAFARIVRQQRDLDEIRAIGRAERRRARNHLDFRVEAIYTDLGMERPQ